MKNIVYKSKKGLIRRVKENYAKHVENKHELNFSVVPMTKEYVDSLIKYLESSKAILEDDAPTKAILEDDAPKIVNDNVDIVCDVIHISLIEYMLNDVQIKRVLVKSTSQVKIHPK